MRLIDADALNLYDISPAYGFSVYGVTTDGLLRGKTKMEKIRKILDHYGEEHQIRKTIEELDELKEALEGGHNIEHILEECADVMIMLNQLSLIYDFDKSMINVMMEYKIERTLLRIREEKNDAKRSE